jgi:hypothetical protein
LWRGREVRVVAFDPWSTFTDPAKHMQSGEAARVQSHDDLATYSLTTET